MKKILVLFSVLIILLALSASVATAGDGDPIPGVAFNPLGVSCSIKAGDYGWFATYDWWWATYSTDTGVLKCITHLADWQTPPAELTIYPFINAGCGTPEGITLDGFTKVFPDGAVHLICRLH